MSNDEEDTGSTIAAIAGPDMSRESIQVDGWKHKLRVFCVSCEKRAEILMLGDQEMLIRFLHVRCHGEELIAWLPEIAVRRTQATTRDREHLDFVWNELDAIDTVERLDHSMLLIEKDIARADDLISLEQPPEADRHIRKARADRQALHAAMASVRRNLIKRGHAVLVAAGAVSQAEIDKEG